MSAPCNICGTPWPKHHPACAYVHTAWRVTVLEDALRDLLIHIPNGTAIDPYKAKAYRVLGATYSHE